MSLKNLRQNLCYSNTKDVQNIQSNKISRQNLLLYLFFSKEQAVQ